ncbi:MAG TPA: cytochrome c [Sphingomicrobium sp.]|nr:cytochrome c [Sphingomicrobium sp.]
MVKVLRWAGYVLAAILILLLLAAGWIWFASNRALAARVEPAQERLVRPSPAQLADGPRQLRVLGCLTCHGDKLEGDAFLKDDKIALLNASNLTRVAARASDQQLAQAIRQGIGHDGRSLLVMPSEHYQFLTDQEVTALIAAIRKMPQTGTDQPPVSLGPIGRVALLTGKLPVAPVRAADYRSSRIADLGPAYAIGRHIVETNCTGCHGPNLKGAEIKPGTVSTDLEIVGAYDLAQFKAMMRTGVAPGGKKLGMMGEAARDDFSHLRDDELTAIHAYLVERAKRAP